MATAGLRLLSAYLNPDDIPAKFKKQPLPPQQYFIGDEADVYNYIVQHVNAHGVRPTSEIVQNKTGMILPPPDAVQFSHLHQEVTYRHQRMTVTKGMLETEKLIKDDSIPPAEAITMLQTYISQAVRSFRNVAAANEAIPEYLEYLHKLKVGAIPLMQSPYLSFNKFNHGAQQGDLISLVAPSGHGKSTTMLYLADWFYREFGAHSLFASGEMSTFEIMSRLIAIRTKTPADIITSGLISSAKQSQIEKEFAGLKDYITIIDSQLSSTVEDLTVISQQVKPHILFVDGAYLLKTADSQFKGWERIKEVAESLKRDVAMAQEMPVFASWQLTTEGSKLAKKGQVAGTEAIGGSVAISQVSSIVIEQIVTDHLTEEGDEIPVLRMTNTKNRNGKAGATWLTAFDYDFMNFGEITGVTPMLPAPNSKNG